MAKRREKRVTMPLPVRIWGLDRNGKVFSQNARTVDVTAAGARVYGVKAPLETGFVVGLECGKMKARFVVAWVGQPGSSREGQIGLRVADNGIWGVTLPKFLEDEFAEWAEGMRLLSHS